ncbi:MAG TPA: hypothetical protein VKG23_17490 [Thermoanaerobaculia bacterium]|nr:hypothetical protein [Thermoanaerobaculia bacterium]
MNERRLLAAVLVACVLVANPRTLAAAEARTITIFEGRQIEIPVPPGWSFENKSSPGKDVQTIELADPKKEIQLDVSFLPDSDGEMSTRKALEDQARKIFVFYLQQSVERDMKLDAFEAPGGLGVVTSFTDKTLDPKHIPAGEKLISTTGIRSWKGVYLIFTLLSDTRSSAAYRTALDVVQKGLKQVKAPASF